MKLNLNKNKKKDKNKINKRTLNLIPIKDYFKDKAFICEDNTILDIYYIACCDVRGLTEDELMTNIYYFTKFLRTYLNDIKIISMHFPTVTIRQQEFVKHKIKTCTNAYHIPFLSQKLLELEYIANNRKDIEFYMMIFSKNSSEYESNINLINKLSNNCFNLSEISMEKKEQILFKLLNQNSKIF